MVNLQKKKFKTIFEMLETVNHRIDPHNFGFLSGEKKFLKISEDLLLAAVDQIPSVCQSVS